MKALSEARKKKGLQAIQLLLNVIHGKMTKETALLIFNGSRRPCRVGAGGICQVHGQLMKDCVE